MVSILQTKKSTLKEWLWAKSRVMRLLPSHKQVGKYSSERNLIFMGTASEKQSWNQLVQYNFFLAALIGKAGRLTCTTLQ